MHRRVLLPLLVLVIALATAIGAGVAQATPPGAVTVSFSYDFDRALPDCQAAECSWLGASFTSPLGTSGTFSSSVLGDGDMTGSFVHAGATAHDRQRIMVNSGGTITAEVRLVAVSGGAGVYVFQGRWLITGGTGAYAGLQGEGETQLVLTIVAGAGTATETWTGRVHTS